MSARRPCASDRRTGIEQPLHQSDRALSGFHDVIDLQRVLGLSGSFFCSLGSDIEYPVFVLFAFFPESLARYFAVSGWAAARSWQTI